MYRELDPARIVETSAQLQQRIAERFPGSSLSRVAREAHEVAGEARSVSAWLARPIYAVRAGVVLAVVLLVLLVGVAFSMLKLDLGSHGFSESAQGVEAAINDLVFVGIAIYFLVGIERRIKRARACAAW